ncbi:MAG: hypothetical protein ACE5IP_09855 [Terriglobia bacterium]
MSRCDCRRIVTLLFVAFVVVSLLNLYQGWVIVDQMQEIRWLTRVQGPLP